MRWLVVMALAMTGVIAWWQRSVTAPVPVVEVSPAKLQAEQSPRTVPIEVISSTAQVDPLHGHVREKYAVVLEGAAPTDIAAVERLLLKREHLRLADDAPDVTAEMALAPVNASGNELARIEQQLRELLPFNDYRRYELLKDGDIELQLVTEYSNGLQDIAPLSAAQRSTLLLRRLQHREQLDRDLSLLGLDRDHLSEAERTYAHRMVIDTVRASHAAFMADAQNLLEPEQLVALEAFERSESERWLRQLQQQINAK